MISFFVFLVSALSPQHEAASTLMKGIWSPYCKGISLLECPSGKAEDLREEIYQRMEAGETQEAIWKDLQARYGDSLQMNPLSSGREGWAHLLPWILSGLGSIFVALFWISRSKRPPVKASGPIDAKMEERILKDLQDRQG